MTIRLFPAERIRRVGLAPLESAACHGAHPEDEIQTRSVARSGASSGNRAHVRWWQDAKSLRCTLSAGGGAKTKLFSQRVKAAAMKTITPVRTPEKSGIEHLRYCPWPDLRTGHQSNNPRRWRDADSPHSRSRRAPRFGIYGTNAWGKLAEQSCHSARAADVDLNTRGRLPLSETRSASVGGYKFKGGTLCAGILGTRTSRGRRRKQDYREAEIRCHHRGHGRGFVSRGRASASSSRRALPAVHPAVFFPCTRSGARRAPTGRARPPWGGAPRVGGCRFVDRSPTSRCGSPDNLQTMITKAMVGTATALSFGDSVRRPGECGTARLL